MGKGILIPNTYISTAKNKATEMRKKEIPDTSEKLEFVLISQRKYFYT